jgi:adenylate cyclase
VQAGQCETDWPRTRGEIFAGRCVQRSGNQVRINAQLIAADTDAHLWAERFDRELSDLFALQNEITGRIAVALNAEMIGAEAARPTERPGVTDYIFRGRAPFLKPLSRETYDEAVGYYERALALQRERLGDPRVVPGFR